MWLYVVPDWNRNCIELQCSAGTAGIAKKAVIGTAGTTGTAGTAKTAGIGLTGNA